MTLATSNNKVSYVSSGTETLYDFDFPALSVDFIKVFIDNVEQGSGFTITLDPSGTGGTVALSAPAFAGNSVVILRDVPLTQGIDYNPYGPFPSETHERGLDLGVARDQQLQEQLGRSLKFPIGSDINGQIDASPNDVLVVNPDGSVGGVPLIDFAPDSAAQLRMDLASNTDPTKGAALVGNAIAQLATYMAVRALPASDVYSQIYVAGRSNIFDGAQGHFQVDATDSTSADNDGTVLVDAAGRRWKRQWEGPVKMAWWVDQFSDAIQTSGVQAAIDYTAALSGPTHDTNYAGSSPTPPAFYQQYGAVRTLEWVPCKVRVASTITLKNAISVIGNNGGLLADESWSGSGFILDQDWLPYSGRITDLTVDGNETTAKGIRCRSASFCYWQNIKVVAVRDDGFVHLDGPECIIEGLEVVTSMSPVSRQVAGFKSRGADSHYNNIVTRFSPVGIWQEGNGNNNYLNCHPWGLYGAQKMYIAFYVKDSSGNQFSLCYADSPTKADYAQSANSTLPDGFINGGYGWLFAGTSRDNVIGGDCHCFINESDYLAAGNPNAPHLWMVGFHGGLPNIVEGITERPGSFFWNTTFQYLTAADRQNARVMRAVRSERRRVGGNTQSTGWRHASGFGTKIQDLGNVSGNWAVDFSSGCYVKLNTTAPTTLQPTGWPDSDVDNTAADVTLFITGTNAPSFSVNIRTPANAALPAPSVRGLMLRGVWDPVLSVLVFHTVVNL